jgi:hypothetical protein
MNPILSSPHLRSRPFPRRKATQVPHPQPVHLPTLQRRPANLSRTTGTFNINSTSSPSGCSLPTKPYPSPPFFSQFAYHETSFFLIRLLQQFSSISHIFDAQPPDSRPPPEWTGAEGPKGRDKIRIKTHITLSVMGGCWVELEEANPAAEAEGVDGNDV